MRQKKIEWILLGVILASFVTNILMQQFYLDSNVIHKLDICYQCRMALRSEVYGGLGILSLQAPLLIVMIFVLVLGKKTWRYMVVVGIAVLNLKDGIRLILEYLEVPSIASHEVETIAAKNVLELVSVQCTINLIVGVVVNILYIAIVVVSVTGFIDQIKGERKHEK